MTVTPARFGRAFLALVLAAVAAGLIAPAGAKPTKAAFPGANGKIAFASSRTSGAGVDNPGGDSEIFTMNPDGKGIEQLTVNVEANDFESAVTVTSVYALTSEVILRPLLAPARANQTCGGCSRS